MLIFLFFFGLAKLPFFFHVTNVWDCVIYYRAACNKQVSCAFDNKRVIFPHTWILNSDTQWEGVHNPPVMTMVVSFLSISAVPEIFIKITFWERIRFIQVSNGGV